MIEVVIGRGGGGVDVWCCFILISLLLATDITKYTITVTSKQWGVEDTKTSIPKCIEKIQTEEKTSEKQQKQQC